MSGMPTAIRWSKARMPSAPRRTPAGSTGCGGMLVALSIRDVLLIDKLDLAFHRGLTVLTGETGAGKSILLDSLGLALGARSEGGLVRPGAQGLSVTAEFDLPADHAVRRILLENDMSPSDTLLLRRAVGSDGRSRAFVDDQPVS